MLSQASFAGMRKDKPPGMGSRRPGVHYRQQAAWRFGLSDLIEAGGGHYCPVKGGHQSKTCGYLKLRSF